MFHCMFWLFLILWIFIWILGWTCHILQRSQLWFGRNCIDSPEKTMAPHSSTLAWKIPWTEEPGGLQSMGSLRVRHNWVTSLSLSCIGEGNGNPLQCSCLENPRDRGAWWAAVYGVAKSQTWRSDWTITNNSVLGTECIFAETVATDLKSELSFLLFQLWETKVSSFYTNFKKLVNIYLVSIIF